VRPVVRIFLDTHRQPVLDQVGTAIRTFAVERIDCVTPLKDRYRGRPRPDLRGSGRVGRETAVCVGGEGGMKHHP